MMIKRRKIVEKRWTKKMAENLFSRISSSSLMELAVIAFQNDDKHAPITIFGEKNSKDFNDEYILLE